MKILLSNDDGVKAVGLEVLAKSFSSWGDIKVSAPERERSTTGHSLTLHKPLRMKKEKNGFFSVSGGPADCVYLGMFELFDGRPDIVISGINRGANLGQDIFYSGTVSAAREAVVQKLPAVAVSLCLDTEWKKLLKNPKYKFETHYKSAAQATKYILEKLLLDLGGTGGTRSARLKRGLKNWPQNMLLNINVPNLPFSKIKGYKLARQGFRHYSGDIVKRKDARGRDYFWIGGTFSGFAKIVESDNLAVANGFVSITPLELDTTDRASFELMKNVWSP